MILKAFAEISYNTVLSVPWKNLSLEGQVALPLYLNKNRDTLPLCVNLQNGDIQLSRRGKGSSGLYDWLIQVVIL